MWKLNPGRFINNGAEEAESDPDIVGSSSEEVTHGVTFPRNKHRKTRKNPPVGLRNDALGERE